MLRCKGIWVLKADKIKSMKLIVIKMRLNVMYKDQPDTKLAVNQVEQAARD